MVQIVATHLVAFVLGGLLWGWVMKQLAKFFKKNG